MPAGSVARLEVLAGARGHLLAIRPELLESTFRQIPEAAELHGILHAEKPLALSVTADVAAVIARAMALIGAELRDLAPGAQTVISSALVISLVQLWRHVGATALVSGGPGGTAALLLRFRQLVEERFRDHWPIARYAEGLGVSTDRLHAVCTRSLGRSPRALVHSRILHEAVTRLERSAVTIKQLTFLLGFKDAAHFNRFFRNRLGLPPGAYRRNVAAREAAKRARPMVFTFADWP
jgi:AraC family transcriptional activator of pobA